MMDTDKDADKLKKLARAHRAKADAYERQASTLEQGGD